MALDDLVRSGVALAQSLTSPLQATVTHEAFVSQDSYGKVTYGAAVSRKALVERKVREFREIDGRVRQSRSKVTFLEAVEVDNRDRITLPDGRIGPILDVQGLILQDGSQALTECFMG